MLYTTRTLRIFWGEKLFEKTRDREQTKTKRDDSGGRNTLRKTRFKNVVHTTRSVGVLCMPKARERAGAIWYKSRYIFVRQYRISRHSLSPVCVVLFCLVLSCLVLWCLVYLKDKSGSLGGYFVCLFAWCMLVIWSGHLIPYLFEVALEHWKEAQKPTMTTIEVKRQVSVLQTLKPYVNPAPATFQGDISYI